MPKALAEEKELGAKEWFDTVTKAMGGEVEIKEESEECIVAICKGSKEKELFPLKMRDAGSSAGYQMLLKKGLIPDNGAALKHCACVSGGGSCAVRCAACGARNCDAAGVRRTLTFRRPVLCPVLCVECLTTAVASLAHGSMRQWAPLWPTCALR